MNFVIKVADFGLSEQLETKDYFRQDKGEGYQIASEMVSTRIINGLCLL